MGKKTSIAFAGTKEQEKQLVEIIDENKDKKGALMPVLQHAQSIYGYLPLEVQTMVADGLGYSLEEVYGVATFYSQFSMSPKGKYKIGVCMGTACYVKGAEDVLDRIKLKLNINMGECTEDGLFSLEDTRCLGCCGLAPVMVINDSVYGRLKPEEVDEILLQYKD